MKIFLDTADVGEIARLIGTGLIDGVTTNPSLIAKSGRDHYEVVKQICGIVAGPVSAEVTFNEEKDMIKQGVQLSKLADNVVVKVPLTTDGLKACIALRAQGIKVNVTLCFSLNQAILAAKCGATFISPFVGRLDDKGVDGLGLVNDIVKAYKHYEYDTEVLVASVRYSAHVTGAINIGAHVVTLPVKIFEELNKHQLTDQGLQKFMEDWNNSKKSS